MKEKDYILHDLRNVALRIQHLDSLLVMERIGLEEYTNYLKEMNKELDDIQRRIDSIKTTGKRFSWRA